MSSAEVHHGTVVRPWNRQGEVPWEAHGRLHPTKALVMLQHDIPEAEHRRLTVHPGDLAIFKAVDQASVRGVARYDEALRRRSCKETQRKNQLL